MLHRAGRTNQSRKNSRKLKCISQAKHNFSREILSCVKVSDLRDKLFLEQSDLVTFP